MQSRVRAARENSAATRRADAGPPRAAGRRVAGIHDCGEGAGALGWRRGAMVIPQFQSKSGDRWSDQLTAWGVLDMALRGTEEQWWELYQAARRDPAVRGLLRRMLPLADPELVGGRRLWQALLDHFESAAPRP